MKIIQFLVDTTNLIEVKDNSPFQRGDLVIYLITIVCQYQLFGMHILPQYTTLVHRVHCSTVVRGSRIRILEKGPA